MKECKLLSDKELDLVCGSGRYNQSEISKAQAVGISAIAIGIVTAPLIACEVAHIDSDLSYEDDAWEKEKSRRMSSAESFGANTHSNVIRNCKKGLATSLVKCHNSIVDFFRKH